MQNIPKYVTGANALLMEQNITYKSTAIHIPTCPNT